jgi:hypothetical protein
MEKNKKVIDVLIISILLIIFGTGETITFLIDSIKSNNGLFISKIFTIPISLGLIYFICGIILIPQKKWSLKISICLLILNIIIRIYMLFTKLFPTNTPFFVFGYTTGMSMVIFFIIFLFVRRNIFLK